jgi:hypothetical protein
MTSVKQWRDGLSRIQKAVQAWKHDSSAHEHSDLQLRLEHAVTSNNNSNMLQFMPQPPDAKSVLDSCMATNHGNNKLVWGRLDSLSRLIPVFTKRTQQAWLNTTQTITDSCTKTIDVLLQNGAMCMLGNVRSVAATLSDLFQERVDTPLTKFCQQHKAEQLQQALETQQKLFARLQHLHNERSEWTQHLLHALAQEIEHDDHDDHHNKPKFLVMIQDLHRDALSMHENANLHYSNQQRLIVELQPFSHTLYQNWVAWLLKFQQLLAHVLLSKVHDHDDSSGKDDRNNIKRSSSALERFANRQGKPRLLDVENQASFDHPHPSIATTFILEYAKSQHDHVKTSLTNTTEQAHALASSFNTVKANVQKLRAASSTNNSTTSVASPEEIKNLLRLDQMIGKEEARMGTMYSQLTKQLGPRLNQLESESVSLQRVVSYLNHVDSHAHSWQQVIREESASLGSWKAKQQANNQFITGKLFEWVCFCQQEVTSLRQALSLYTNNTFQRAGECLQILLEQSIALHERERSSTSEELDLMTNLFEDIRHEDAKCADKVARLQKELETWSHSAHVGWIFYQSAKLKQIVLNHIDALSLFLGMLDHNNNGTTDVTTDLQPILQRYFACTEKKFL